MWWFGGDFVGCDCWFVLCLLRVLWECMFLIVFCVVIWFGVWCCWVGL